MKKNLFFVFLITIVSSALGTTQTSIEQDKPPRLYVKSYTENSSGTTTITTSSGQHNDYSVNDNANWQDGAAGTFSWKWQGTFSGPSFTDAQNDSVNLSWSQSFWPNFPIPTWAETYTDELWPGADYTNNVIGGYAPIAMEHCNLGSPLFDNSGTYNTSPGNSISITATGFRTGQAIMKLQTGGKAISRLRNLFSISASAIQLSPIHKPESGYYEWLTLMPYHNDEITSFGTITSVPLRQINIGSYGPLLTNGVKYLVLPDNKDVDVTPYVAGANYYQYLFGQPTKYLSYLDIFVQQANPGYSLNFASLTNDVGHVFWQFRTDAPSDALQYISPSLAVFLGSRWGFYPSDPDNLFTAPGQLENDTSHTFNISRTFHIGFPDLLQGLEYTKGISNAPPTFVLTAFNCGGAARGAGYSADIFGLPLDESPQNFGVTLIEMYPAPGQVVGPFIDTQDIFYSDAPY